MHIDCTNIPNITARLTIFGQVFGYDIFSAEGLSSDNGAIVFIGLVVDEKLAEHGYQANSGIGLSDSPDVTP